MTFGSLFSGIGGLDLGFERAGFRCVWQVESNDYCQRVLAKHWPNVRRHGDVRTFPPAEGDWSADAICGGFPCQDISRANPNRAGLDGERSGLWTEFARVVRVLRPRYVVVENVPALLSPLADDAGRIVGPAPIAGVLGDMAALGFDAEWTVLSAADCGAPHLRERVFIVAHTHRERRNQGSGPQETGNGQWAESQGRARHAPHAGSPRLPIPEQRTEPSQAKHRHAAGAATPERNWWAVEPDVVRMVHGVSRRVDRIRGLGNAVTPQQAEIVARWLLTMSASESSP